jgi:hypothetical protein
MITAFWSYQIPGLNGLTAFINADRRSGNGCGTSAIVAGPRCRLA